MRILCAVVLTVMVAGTLVEATRPAETVKVSSPTADYNFLQSAPRSFTITFTDHEADKVGEITLDRATKKWKFVGDADASARALIKALDAQIRDSFERDWCGRPGVKP